MKQLTESKEMLKEAERTGAVKIMVPVAELKFMLQAVEEMQKTLEWYADPESYNIFLRPTAIVERGELARQTLQSLKGDKP